MTPSATAEGTRSYATRFRERFAPRAFRDLGRTGLTVSALGFGCYRIDDEREPHVAALKDALQRGVNLIDTSTNYTDGGSERAVGRVLRELAESGAVPREQVVVVTKAGYVQGKNLANAVQREQEGRPFPDMVKYADGCWHCLHPEFLQDQIERSLQRLGLPRADVLLLHNPEYFLSDAKRRRSGTLTERRDEFYRRIREAFRFLEAQCDAGTIAWYGVSSNTFVVPEGDAEATSLHRMLEIAGDVAQERGASRDAHRFAVAQMPVNLLETGAARLANNPGGRTALEVAREAGVAVLVNRPLNAFADGRLVRLADWPARAPGVSLNDAASEVEALEAEFARDIAPSLALPGGAPELFRWGSELRENASRLRDAMHARQVESDYIRPHLEHALHHVGLHLVGKPRNDWAAWKPRYEAAIERLLGAVADLSHQGAQRSSDAVRSMLPAMGEAWRGRTFSQQALGALLGTEGVTCVLVGMREPRWVGDALGAMEVEPSGGLA